MSSLLALENLQTTFRTREGEVHAVRGVSFQVQPGELVGIVGESGCGKSVTCKSIIQLLGSNGRITGGSIRFQNDDLAQKTPAQMRAIRGNEIAMIFQDPMTALNPVLTIGKQMAEILMRNKGLTKRAAKAAAIAMLEQVGIAEAERRYDQYPHEFSGGMRQRVMIAIALSCNPKLLIADEPTTALDVTVQAQILQLLRQLKQAQPHSAVILVTHDMGVIAENADRVAVMYAGQIVEEANVIPLFHRPLHPYTEGLMASMPSLTEEKEHLETIEGTVPSIYNMPIGCAFCNRCKYAKDCCRKVEPKMMTLPADESGIIRRVRCLKYDENYRKEWENG